MMFQQAQMVHDRRAAEARHHDAVQRHSDAVAQVIDDHECSTGRESRELTRALGSVEAEVAQSADLFYGGAPEKKAQWAA